MRWLCGWLLLLAGGWAPAHEVRPAYLQLTELDPGHFEVVWKQPVLGDRRLPLEPALPDDCDDLEEPRPEHTGTALIQRWQVACDLRRGQLGIDGLQRTLTDAMIRIDYRNGDSVQELLRPARPFLDLADPHPPAGAYFLLGVEHLLFGVDHVLFVIGLVLFIRRPWLLVKTVTAFTVAHSITLALSVLSLVQLPQGPVEAVIALSILFLARELVVPESRRSRLTLAAPWLMAFAFGLLHGFGFAGALAELGLPRDQLAAALLLFNLGIEAGQLAVVAVLLGLAWLAQRLAAAPARLLERAFPLAMGCAAGFWTIDRIVVLF